MTLDMPSHLSHDQFNILAKREYFHIVIAGSAPTHHWIDQAAVAFGGSAGGMFEKAD